MIIYCYNSINKRFLCFLNKSCCLNILVAKQNATKAPGHKVALNKYFIKIKVFYLSELINLKFTFNKKYENLS